MNKNIKIPAIRSQMGIWVYYVSSLSFSEVTEFVRPINDELHKSELLSGMIQRSITENYKSIANYLETQEERFFNALILAVYDGQPMWNEIRLDDYDGGDNYNMGMLTLSGDEKIFPVDGQHRVAGIKKALEKNNELGKERVAVIFVGHSKDEIGMQRTRRMFSTLNRYAKPVSLRDIIALDEDDIVAIASRNLIDEAELFKGERILDSKTKAIPDGNNKAITSIITYYECNKELLWLYVKDIEVKGLDEEKIIKGRNNKITEYIRHRPDDDIIAQFTNECENFWNALINSVKYEMDDTTGSIGRLRDDNGGHIFFRPAALLPFTKMVVRVKEKENIEYSQIIMMIPEPLRWIQHRLWRKILWDENKKNMIMGNSKLVELIFLYIYDKNLLTVSEINKIRESLVSVWDYHEHDLMERFDDIITGDVS